MADIQIKVSTQELRRAADNVDGYIRTVRQSFDAINSTVQKTSMYWEGEGGSYFRSGYTSYKDDINMVINRLKDQVINLRQMAGIYEETESQTTSIGSGLPDDILM